MGRFDLRVVIISRVIITRVIVTWIRVRSHLWGCSR